MTYCHPLCAMSIGPPILRYSYFKIWPWKSMVKVMCVVKGQGHVWPSKFKGQGYGQVQTHWSHLRPGVQSICLLFVSWQSDHFWLRYRKFHIWPWKFKAKVMAKVKPDGHIWALEFNRYVCFSFCGNRTILGWDIANSIFDLENMMIISVFIIVMIIVIISLVAVRRHNLELCYINLWVPWHGYFVRVYIVAKPVYFVLLINLYRDI